MLAVSSHLYHRLDRYLEIVTTLRDLQRWCGGPVAGPVVADHVGLPPRTARYYLARLEQAGLVHRPAGPRSGWVANL